MLLNERPASSCVGFMTIPAFHMAHRLIKTREKAYGHALVSATYSQCLHRSYRPLPLNGFRMNAADRRLCEDQGTKEELDVFVCQ